ncbi:DUF934 domain-containing protein [Hwanghaeella sp.]|uniref:DUF934 domain-containing protein n=1 Tax=Hwanghaeella sp. TaxID=2605943 RepID=UPI003CCBB93F
MPLFKYGKEIADEWVLVDDDAALPDASHLIVPLGRWQNVRHELISRPAQIGVALAADEFADAIAEDLPHLALVQVHFPSFADGRAFSTARALREHHGFDGEIRATGDVLLDQIQFMQRCGIDAFQVTNEPTIKRLREGRLAGVDLFYQPARDGRTTIIDQRRRRGAESQRLAS